MRRRNYTSSSIRGISGEVEVEMACMDADVDYDDVRCPRRVVVVANLASEWYDVRVLSFVWIRRGRFSCEKSTEETRAWVAFAVLFWLFSFLVIMKVGTLSDRRDGIIRGRRARFGKVSLFVQPYHKIDYNLADLLLVGSCTDRFHRLSSGQ
jgi:hypothetical protein